MLTVFIRLSALGAYFKFLDLDSGHLFEVGTYSIRLDTY